MPSFESLLVLVTAVGALASLLPQLIESIRKKRRREETTEDRVKRLIKSLEESVSLIGSIEGEIRARSNLARQLEQDVEQYNRLVELRKPEVEAIAQLLRGELAREGRSTFWKGFAVNFLFFALGAVISLLVTIWSSR